LEFYRIAWKKTSYTIITVGWINKKRRTILNFLVKIKKGTVLRKYIDSFGILKITDKICKMLDNTVEEIGEGNLVQIITDNDANYKTPGELMMRKKEDDELHVKHLCEALGIDLMLEDFEKKVPVNQKYYSKM